MEGCKKAPNCVAAGGVAGSQVGEVGRGWRRGGRVVKDSWPCKAALNIAFGKPSRPFINLFVYCFA